jgi:hypothetical protein
MTGRKPATGETQATRPRPTRLFDAIVAASVAVGVIAGGLSLLTGDGGQLASSHGLTAEELEQRVTDLRTPAYWVGPKPDSLYRLTARADGAVFIRYLPRGAVRDSQPVLTVATYPRASAYGDVQAAARRAGAVRIALAGNAVAMFERARPTNVFVAFPSLTVQVEVFDPVPAEARRLVESGAVTTVGESSRPLARAFFATEPELRRFASSLPERAYWAGPRADRRYEVTHTSSGATFVRYLPPGAEVGTAGARYLTVVTYPRRAALRVLRAAARAPGAKTISISGGGLGVYYGGVPTNVHLAFPDGNVEVEVFSPSKEVAIELVRRGAIEPLS